MTRLYEVIYGKFFFSIIFWQTQEHSTPHSILHQYVIILFDSIKSKDKDIATDIDIATNPRKRIKH